MRIARLVVLAVLLSLLGLTQTNSALAEKAAGGPSNTGASPVQAAKNFLRPGRALRIERTNVVGDLAVVRFSGAAMEGDNGWNGALLIQHFPFGWQIVDLLNADCSLSARHLPRETVKHLSAGIHLAHAASSDARCSYVPDRGPVRDIVAIRSLRRGAYIVNQVRVVGDYAAFDWFLPGGGESALARRGSAWIAVMSGGGVFGASDLVAKGIPRAAACELLAADNPDRHSAACK
jgi:hypothetical protein